MTNRTFTPVGLDAPVLSFIDRASKWAAMETYHVLEQRGQQVEWVQTPAGHCEVDCVADLADGQYPDAIVVRRTGDGRFENVTTPVAQAVLDKMIANGGDIKELPRIVKLYIKDAWQQIEEALEDEELERRFQNSLRVVGLR